MRKLFLLIMFAGAAVTGSCDESWLGLYMLGGKIGYAFSSTVDTTLNKVPAIKSDSSMVINTSLMGQELHMRVDSTSWLDKHGKPILMEFSVKSGGRDQRIDALFTSTEIHLSIDNSGVKSSKVIPLPHDAGVVDDAVEAILQKGYKVGTKKYYYVLDPETVSLVKNRITLEGQATTNVHGKQVTGNKIEIYEPRSTSYCYLTAKGGLIKVEGPMGMEMFPESRAEAMKEAPPGEKTADLAFSTSLTPDKPIADVGAVTDLKLRITGHDLSALPSDSHQTVSQEGDSWIVDVHPVSFQAKVASIHQSASEEPEWIKPSFNIPSKNPTFVKLAAKLTAGAENVAEAAKRIHDFVFRTMKPNAGIGVLRDAGEILKTKEGVCRDYAVLTATLMRAAHIPAQVVSGLVYEEGSFYYHAWAEVWDGSHWIGVDSTLPNGKLTAGHIQLAQGSVEQAFTFTFLDKVRIEVLDARRA